MRVVMMTLAVMMTGVMIYGGEGKINIHMSVTIRHGKSMLDGASALKVPSALVVGATSRRREIFGTQMRLVAPPKKKRKRRVLEFLYLF